MAANMRAFRNLLGRENRVWWGSSRWLLVIGLAGGINVLLAFVLFALPAVVEAQGDTIDIAEAGMQIFFGLSFVAFALAVIVFTQDAIIGEKESGVAEWVLSKPISRSVYVVAKLVAAAIPVMALMVTLHLLLAVGLFALAGIPIGVGFLAAGGLLALHTLFYLIFSLLLGVLTENRGVLLGVLLGSLLGGTVLVSLVGPLTLWTPWPLTQVASALALGAEVPPALLASIGFTTLWCILGVWLALSRFERADLS